ncbi:MAG: hypothetical protein EAX96_10710 [Candidatus Lokiarchaeota archaeon]|nr:hypothetical protein [Candidatus Lokiarchaeota archaeon]
MDIKEVNKVEMFVPLKCPRNKEERWLSKYKVTALWYSPDSRSSDIYLNVPSIAEYFEIKNPDKEIDKFCHYLTYEILGEFLCSSVFRGLNIYKNCVTQMKGRHFKIVCKPYHVACAMLNHYYGAYDRIKRQKRFKKIFMEGQEHAHQSLYFPKQNKKNKQK